MTRVDEAIRGVKGRDGGPWIAASPCGLFAMTMPARRTARYPPGFLIAFCFMRRRRALSASVSEAETGQSLLMMKSTSAGASVTGVCEAAISQLASGRFCTRPRRAWRPHRRRPSRQAPSIPSPAPWQRPSRRRGRPPVPFAKPRPRVAAGRRDRRRRVSGPD